jgi:hypothetical protein
LGNLEWAVDTKSDEAKSSVAVADMDYDLNYEIAGGTTSGWCIEVFDKTGSWTPGVSDAAWTFPYEPQRNGSFMWHSSPAIGELMTGPNHEGLEVIAGNNPLMSIWAFDGNNSDGIDDGQTTDLTSWGFPGPTGTEGVDWDVLWVFQTNGSIIASPAVGDVDGDGLNEVVCGSKDSLLYCLNGQTGALKWSYHTGAMITSSAGLADFDNNGKLEVVVGSQDSSVYFIKGDLNNDGIINPSEVTSFHTGGAVMSSPAIADVDGNGTLDVIIGSDDFKIYCLGYSPATNSVSSNWSYLTGNVVQSSPAIANSGRPMLTIYAGSADSVLYVLNGDGSLITSYPANGQIVTSPSVADIDGDHKLEIAFTTWGDPDKFMVLRDSASNVTAFASPWPMFRHDARHTGLYNWTPPTFADDVGVSEILDPLGSMMQGTVITPKAKVHNYGDDLASNFPVTFEIRNDSNNLIYTSTQTVGALAPDSSVVVSFPTLIATAGHFHTKAYTTLTGDGDEDDNVRFGVYQVIQSQWVQDFESDGGGCNPDGWPNGWEWGVPGSGPATAHSGTRVWATNLNGNYADSVLWQLTSTNFIAQQNHPVLSFWHWFNIEDNRDGGNLKISFDGLNWTRISPVGGYPGIATWNNAGIPDEPCFNGVSNGWELTSFILPVMNTQTFQLSWQLGTDNINNRPGWYLDDLMGYGFVPAVSVVASTTPVLCHGDLSTVTVEATSGTPPFTGTGIFDLPAGQYTFSVTDSNGIFGFTTISIPEPPLLDAHISVTPVPCIGGNSTLSANPTGGTPPYSYLWSNGSSDQAISNVSPGTYSVSVTDVNGCFANAGLLLTQQPPTSIAIAASSNPVASGTPVTFSSSVLNAGSSQFFQWKVNGANAGGNNPSFTYVPSNNDAVVCVMTTGDGCVATSNTVTMIVGGIPANINLQNITVLDGRDKCYDALQNIYVAGGGTTFTVQPGAVATMIAGLKIVYQPGTSVVSGGKMRGYITTNGEYCDAKSVLISGSTEGMPGSPFSGDFSFFRIFPNPTSGNFTLEPKGDKSIGNINVYIFNLFGEKIISTEISGVDKHEFQFSEIPAGIYFVNVIAKDYQETIKLVKVK